MSSSVRVRNRGRAGRLICVGAALLLASGSSVTALLALTSAAAGSLVTAAAHRPGTLDDWRRPLVSAKAAAPAVKTDMIFAEHDASFGRVGSAGLGERLAALGDRLLEARATLDPQPSAVRLAALEPPSQSGWRDAMLMAADIKPAEGPLVAPKAVAEAPRVIAPQPPVQASVIPEPPAMRLASLEQPAPAPVVASLAPEPIVAIAEPVLVPIPRPRPADLARMASRIPAEAVRPEALAQSAPAPRPVALAYATPELETKSDGPNEFFKGLLGGSARLPALRRGIAVYDIATATVHLPSGEMLEAHSGLAHRKDNPAYVREKNRGPTPPNVYDLRMREALFHGAEAIRLTPRDIRKVFNRDGLLAHPYMYVGGGDRSQSNGCVVFKNYGRFLRAFKAGEIAKLVVVPNMAELPTAMAGL